MRDIVIVAATRTAIGKFGGSLSKTSAVDLGKVVIKEAIQRSGLKPEDVDYVVMGNVIQAGLGQNPARQAAVNAGVPITTPAFTVNDLCGSGMKAIHLGMQSIMLGESDVCVVGGFENLSQAPYLVKNARFGTKLNNLETEDAMIVDGYTDAFSNVHMGVTAENVANKYSVSREVQDAFALKSQQKAAYARDNGHFRDEIVAVETAFGLFDTDEYIRSDTNLEKLLKLKSSFIPNGSVTAGNASGINDGAAALVLVAREVAEKLELPILSTIKGFSEVAMDPQTMGYSPYYAVKNLVEKTNISLDSVERFELNEAFASQSYAVVRDLGIDESRVNVNGGAIALGHPIGASGARIVVTLIYEMIRSNSERGIASLCVGGGMGLAILIER